MTSGDTSTWNMECKYRGGIIVEDAERAFRNMSPQNDIHTPEVVMYLCGEYSVFTIPRRAS